MTDDDVGYWLTDAGSRDGTWSKSPFQDIPSACYFALVTMTTVGYGDVSPKSGFGQAFASMFCVGGVIIIALPISVISANFKKNFFEHVSCIDVVWSHHQQHVVRSSACFRYLFAKQIPMGVSRRMTRKKESV
eukprot:COSAG02_NODE_12013_length_1613_cov_2.077279_1_plen_133_part_00